MVFTPELGRKPSNLRCYGLKVELEEATVAKNTYFCRTCEVEGEESAFWQPKPEESSPLTSPSLGRGLR